MKYLKRLPKEREIINQQLYKVLYRIMKNCNLTPLKSYWRNTKSEWDVFESIFTIRTSEHGFFLILGHNQYLIITRYPCKKQ